MPVHVRGWVLQKYVQPHHSPRACALAKHSPAWRVKRKRMAAAQPDMRGEVNHEMTMTDTPSR